MKMWASFILSFALTFAGIANAMETAMPCHSDMDQHAAHSVTSDDDSDGPTGAHAEHHSDHSKPSGNTHATKCASSCCSSFCFVLTQNRMTGMRGQNAYVSSRSTFVVDTFGLVQDRPPKLLG